MCLKITGRKKPPSCESEAEEADELGIELRQTLYGRRRQVYRILFTIEADVVHIHRVRHAAQDRLTEDDI